MQTHIVTTPFGRRPMTLGQIANQATARAIPKEAIVHKWQVFQQIREARDLLGATDRSLAILNALLSFHPETTLTGEGELIVWPSNEQLAARANGMSPATLRRHIAVLVARGLVIRRDSPNGKRFARKGRGGEVEQAYGFDLSPIVARAAEFKEFADATQSERKAFRVAKERLTLLRRDVAKLIEAGIAEEVPGGWGEMQRDYQSILRDLPRSASRALVEDACGRLHGLWLDARKALETFTESEKLNANESQSERHIQNSNPEPPFESEYRLRNEEEAGGKVAQNANLRNLPKRDLPLGIVLDACPALRELSTGGTIRNWRDFLAAADLARPMLGVSPSAWKDAQVTLGEQQAAITLAAIYERVEQIGNAGGYLRSLTERGREGKFSTWPMIMALLRAKLDGKKLKREGTGGEAAQTTPEQAAEPLRVSPELLKALDRKRR